MTTRFEQSAVREGSSGRDGLLRRAVRRTWPIILFVTLAAVTAALVAESRRALEYEATARLLVSPLSQQDPAFFGTDLVRDAGDAAQTPETVAQLLSSRSVVEETARRMGAGWSPQRVLEAVTVESVTGTRVLVVSARAGDPRVAARLATAFTRASVDARRRAFEPQLERRLASAQARRRRLSPDDYSQRDRLYVEIRAIETTLDDEGDPTLRVAEEASVPTTDASRPALIVAAVALAGGLALGLGAAVVLELARSHARTAARTVAARGAGR